MEAVFEWVAQAALFVLIFAGGVLPPIAWLFSEWKREDYYLREITKAKEEGNDKMADALYRNYERGKRGV